MAESKEKIPVKDICPYNYFDDLNPDFKYIEEKQTRFDGEKGYVTMEAIVQRKSDGKYFKFKYENWGRGESSIREETAYEVQRKEKITYYYE